MHFTQYWRFGGGVLCKIELTRCHSFSYLPSTLFKGMVLVVGDMGVVVARGWAATPQIPGISLISSRAISLLYPPPRTASKTICVRSRHNSYIRRVSIDTKHLMTGPQGNSEFCFPETLKGGTKLTVEGNKTHCFPWDQSLSVLLYLPTQGGTIHWCQLMTLLQNVTNPNNLHIK